MKAKKSYGQHFLNNEVIAARIADSLMLTEHYGDVIEVGPGQGMLTKYLLDRTFDLHAVEADQDMITYLHQHYPSLMPRLVYKDFLKLPLEELVADRPFAIIGNFPYNISSQIVFKMLDYKAQVPELVGMFQREMAERIIAPPGGKEYGVISALVQAFYEGKNLFTVKPGHFNPPPKVTSAVIRLTRKEDQELGCDPKWYTKVVKQAFSQRRKMLRNTMKAFLGDHELLKESFFQLRPERLSVAEFVQLTNWIIQILEEKRDSIPSL
jgi:16S rRNA (adenine1518-N6/adenine1519-N6)-dimethyltransferase